MRECLAKYLDYATEAERHVEDADPCIGLVLDVRLYRPFVGIQTHKESTPSMRTTGDMWGRGRLDPGPVMYARDTEIAEDRHEALGFERKRVDIYLSRSVDSV